MAIFHSTTKIISRGKGQSAVASASYRSGEKLVDENSGEIKFYKREVAPETMILAPENAPDWVNNRERLWNEVEKIEKRKDSQLAREIEIALPVELNKEEQKKFVQNYVQDNFVERGMIADVAIHRDNPSNPHAHIMLTTRDITPDGFEKKNRTWNEHSLVDEWRKDLADRINRELENRGISERVSHLSNEERGIEELPTQHLGHKANAMEKRGIETERGNYNRDVKAYNETVAEQKQNRKEMHETERSNEPTREIKQEVKQEPKKENKVEYTPQEVTQIESAAKFLNESFESVSAEKIEKRIESLDKWEKKLDKQANDLRQKDTDFRDIGESYSSISAFQKRLDDNTEKLKTIGIKGFISKGAKHQKESLLRENSHAESVIDKHQQKLTSYQGKYKFSNETEFKALSQKHSAERPKLLEENQNQRRALRNERDVLKNTKSILEDKFIQKVASKYPNQPEMAHINFKTAKAIDSINKESGREISVQEFKEASKNNNFTPEHADSKGRGSSDIFSGIVQGIEQAQRSMERQQTKEHRKSKSKTKPKTLEHERDM